MGLELHFEILSVHSHWVWKEIAFLYQIDGGGNCVHGHDSVHEGGRDGSREVSDKDILVGDASEGRVVLEKYLIRTFWSVMPVREE